MSYTDDQLEAIFDRTDGHCHLCGKKLSFSNYGMPREHRGAWHVEHSNPKANGGTDHGRNLFAGCVVCNLEKGAVFTTSEMRKRAGLDGPPPSRAQKEREQAFWGWAAVVGVLWLIFRRRPAATNVPPGASGASA